MTFLKKYYFHGFILFVYLLVYFLLNDPNTGFFSDDYVWINRYESIGFKGLLSNFGDQFFLPLTYLLQVIEWNIFEENYLPYFVVNSGVFIFSIFILYSLLKKIRTELNLPFYWPEIIVSILLLSPYNTEVLKWYSSQSYLFSTVFLLIACRFYFKYNRSNNPKYLLLLLGSFLISILFKEISLFFPLSILFIEIILFRRKMKIPLLVYLSVILILYFVLRFFFLGELIGGYGTETHLNFSFNKIFNGIAAYSAKFFFLYRYKFGIYFMLLVHSFLFFLFMKIKDKKMLKLLGILFFLFLISLIPVVNLEISFLGSIQSDRYGYLPGIFASIAIGTLFSIVTDKKSVITISLVFGLAQSYFLNETLQYWSRAKAFKLEFVESIKEKSRIDSSFVLLNLPDNYNGIYIFRNGFEQYQKKYFSNSDIVIGVLFQTSFNDSVKSQLKNSELLLTSKEGTFYPYVRSAFSTKSINSKEVLFSIKNKVIPIYFFNNHKLQEIILPQ